MKRSASLAILLMLVASTSMVAQTAFQGLLPGKSVKRDVEQVLGKPVKQLSETLIEYGGLGDAQKTYVQYDKAAIALRIELILAEASQRPKLINSMRLPQEATAAKRNQNGRLEEYFQCPACIVFTYGGANVQDGVTRVAYFAPALYDVAQQKPGEGVDPKEIARGASGTKPASGPTASDPPRKGPATLPADGRPAQPVTSLIPSVPGARVTSLRFFEGDAETPSPTGLRRYKTEFSRSAARAVYYELNVNYEYPAREATYTVTALWSRDNQAEPFTRQDLLFTKPAGLATSSRTYGFGYAEPGKWETGTYTVEIQISGSRVASGTFVIN